MSDNLAYKVDSTSSAENETPWREEIIGGEVVAMSPPSSNHNRVKYMIGLILGNYLLGKRCEFLPDGEGLYLAENEDEYLPDGMVVCDSDKIQADGVHGAPDLVVEILSPSTAKYDRFRKKDMYEKYGVREYWIVSPNEQFIEQYLLNDGRFVLRDVYYKYTPRDLERMKPNERAEAKTQFRCGIFEDLIIRVEDVFSRVK